MMETPPGAAMTPSWLLDQLKRLNIWSKGGQRAPHKPLLLLWAFGRAGWGDAPRLTPYRHADRTRRDDVETQLGRLLTRFGRPRRDGRQQPERPFTRLPNDGLWELEIPAPVAAHIARTGGRRVGWLKRLPIDLVRQCRGGLPAPIWRLLRDDPALVQRAAQTLLDAHFPESLHADIRRAVGLPAGASVVRDRERRDPQFRPAVLKAYERRCAVCDFDVRIEDDLLGLEAAHIKWHKAGGPDEVANGLALCAFHHKALDLGAIGLESRARDVVVLVSDELTGTSRVFDQQLLAFVDRPLRRPQHPDLTPAPAFVAWHRREVFRGAPRRAARR